MVVLKQLCSAAELAELLQITERHVRRLAKKGVLVKAAEGEYRTVPSITGYIEYLNNQIPRKVATSEDAQNARAELMVENTKLAKHKAELARMEEEKEKGLLVYAEDQRRRGANAALAVRNSLQNIPSRISQELAIDNDASSIYRRLETEIGSALSEAHKIIAENIAAEDGVDVIG